MDEILPELIPLICSCLGNKDLLSMALSSHALMEPALDTLWRDIKLFKPLISCLPTDMVEKKAGKYGPTHHLRRKVIPQDLDRYIKAYAHRIRSISMFYGVQPAGKEILSIGVLQGLNIATRFISGALSPNIRNLSAMPVDTFRPEIDEDYADMMASYIFLFTGNRLMNLLNGYQA